MRATATALVIVAAVVSAPAAAQEAESRYSGDIRDLSIGMTLEALVDGEYFDQSCGSNGGPPRAPIGDFENFMECPQEAPSGLREVYFTFDDEWAQIARTNPDIDMNWVHQFSGTVLAGFPVIASLLFDEEGVVRGIRMVTDPRAPVEKRSEAYLLRIPVERRFGRAGWDCVDRPPEEGETEIGGMFIKTRCEKVIDNRRLVLETNFFRKRGQDRFNTLSTWEPGQFESSSRFEIWDASVPRD